MIGATGYIGRAVAKRLQEEGYSIVALARSKESEEKIRKQGLEPYFGTLKEVSGILPILEESDVVIYTAYGYENIETAERELSSKKSHLTDVLHAMFGSNKKFILTSGSGVFPDTGNLIYTEETVFEPINSPLNIARRSLELEVQNAAQHNVHSIILRPPTVYGHGGSFMVPRFLLDHARRTGDSIYCDGTENKKWSAVHVDDLADLFVLAVAKAKAGSVYNTASESEISTLSIAQAISRAAGLQGRTKAISLKEGRELFRHWADWWALNNQCSGEKAKQELGWNPHRVSMLEDIQSGSYFSPLT